MLLIALAQYWTHLRLNGTNPDKALDRQRCVVSLAERSSLFSDSVRRQGRYKVRRHSEDRMEKDYRPQKETSHA